MGKFFTETHSNVIVAPPMQQTSATAQFLSFLQPPAAELFG
jgi:hypothetical protein